MPLSSRQDAIAATAGARIAPPASLWAVVDGELEAAGRGGVVVLSCPSLIALRATRDEAVSRGAPLLLLPLERGGGAASPAPAAGRRKLAGAPPSCDGVCVSQTSLIQFTIVFLIFIILALSGTCCLHALEGPDRFELTTEQKHGQ